MFQSTFSSEEDGTSVACCKKGTRFVLLSGTERTEGLAYTNSWRPWSHEIPEAIAMCRGNLESELQLQMTLVLLLLISYFSCDKSVVQSSIEEASGKALTRLFRTRSLPCCLKSTIPAESNPVVLFNLRVSVAAYRSKRK